MIEANHKDDRAKEIIRQLAADFIQQESNNQSMITVTNVSTNRDMSQVTIFVTAFPEHKQTAVIDFLKRNRSEFKHYVKQNSKLARIPQFDFEIDFGEKSRQRIEEIL
jgi:ribosome-binding factor A